MSFWDFLKEIEKDKWSFSRISGFFLILFYIIGGGYIVLTTKQFPDIPQWLGITILSLYGINRIACPTKNFITGLTKSSNKSSHAEKSKN